MTMAMPNKAAPVNAPIALRFHTRHACNASLSSVVRRFAMRAKQSVAVAGTILFVAATLLYIVSRTSPLPHTPITIHYARSDSVGGPYAVFWVTNLTDRAVDLRITGIDARTNRGWTNYLENLPMSAGLRFRIGNGSWTSVLGPSRSSLGFTQIPNLSTNGAWRIRLSVAEQLQGTKRLVAGIEQFVSELVWGHTFVLPFSKGRGYLGRPCDIVSPEFFNEYVGDITQSP